MHYDINPCFCHNLATCYNSNGLSLIFIYNTENYVLTLFTIIIDQKPYFVQGSIVPSSDCPKDGSAKCIHNRGGTYGNVTVNLFISTSFIIKY